MAVGLEEHTEDVWSLFTGRCYHVVSFIIIIIIIMVLLLAISVHKLVITFTMSLELLQTGPTMFVFLTYLVTFSLVNPVGIGLGMIISHTGHSDGVTEAVFQGRLWVCLTYFELPVFPLQRKPYQSQFLVCPFLLAFKQN